MIIYSNIICIIIQDYLHLSTLIWIRLFDHFISNLVGFPLPAFPDTRDLSDHSNVQYMVLTRPTPPPPWPPRSCGRPRGTSPPPGWTEILSNLLIWVVLSAFEVSTIQELQGCRTIPEPVKEEISHLLNVIWL